ncbi:MAG: hypothetical protein KatS3mg115_0773 [Candidatus Poribacteria bacterium]|nr:MAG: hypothetical protein KatS3mg115_0773 [Candidatus Poribacteria bacterium]
MKPKEATALFSNPWQRYSFGGWLQLAALWYGRVLLPSLLVAVGLLLGGGGISYWAVRAVEAAGWVRFFSPPERVSLAVSWTLLLLLLATPFTTVWAFGRIARSWLGRRVPTPSVRWYRLVGVALYLWIPLGVLAGGFPLGLIALPIYVWWMFAPLVVVVEGEGGRAALRRSRYLSLGEFSATALPVVLSFALFFIGLTMAQRIVPHPPRGFQVTVEGKYVRPLTEAEEYDPETRLITEADGRLTPVPEEAYYDAESRVLVIPAPEPLSAEAAWAWAGVPTALAALLDPIRWYLVALLYLGLRRRREGWSAEQLARELELPGRPLKR